MTFDGKAFGDEVVTAVHDFLTAKIAPALERIAELEAKLAAMPVPKDGRDGPSLDEVASMIDAAVAKAVAEAPVPVDGRDGADGRDGPSLDDIAPMLKEEVAKAVAALPPPVDGRDGADGAPGRDAPSLDELSGVIASEVEKAVSAIPAPKDGKDGFDGADGRDAPTIDDLSPIISEAVAKAVAEIPIPKDGQDGRDGKDGASVDDMTPTIMEAVAKAVSEIPVPKDGRDGIDGKDGADGQDGRDGVSLAGALIDRKGNLVVTLSDGTTRDLGDVVGKDGVPGTPGKDGVDGVGWDDMDASYDGERTVTFRWQKDERVIVREFVMPVVLDRGVFKQGEAYAAGDGVTWAGSFWIAQEETNEKPDSGKGWRLAVKRGRDGKDGIVKAEKPAEPLRIGAPKKGDA